MLKFNSIETGQDNCFLEMTTLHWSERLGRNEFNCLGNRSIPYDMCSFSQVHQIRVIQLLGSPKTAPESQGSNIALRELQNYGPSLWGWTSRTIPYYFGKLIDTLTMFTYHRWAHLAEIRIQNRQRWGNHSFLSPFLRRKDDFFWAGTTIYQSSHPSWNDGNMWWDEKNGIRSGHEAPRS